jgi:hypothetical protein
MNCLLQILIVTALISDASVFLRDCYHSSNDLISYNVDDDIRDYDSRHKRACSHKLFSMKENLHSFNPLECSPTPMKLPKSLNELQRHGTTTLAFIYKDSVIIAVDSMASIGSYVGSRTVKKVLPITDRIVATMAGGAGDCSYWIKWISSNFKYYEKIYDISQTVVAAKLLSDSLRQYRGHGLSIGTMIAGWDSTVGPSCEY